MALIFERIQTDGIAELSYLVGDDSEGVAAVFDPRTKPTAFKIPIPRDEKQRLAALNRYDILDTPPEKSFDSITVLDNRALGTLCVIDKVVGTLTGAQKKDLLAPSRLVMTELELCPSLRDKRRTKKLIPGRRSRR